MQQRHAMRRVINSIRFVFVSVFDVVDIDVEDAIVVLGTHQSGGLDQPRSCCMLQCLIATTILGSHRRAGLGITLHPAAGSKLLEAGL